MRETLTQRVDRLKALPQRKCKNKNCARTTPYLCRSCDKPVCQHHGTRDDEQLVVRTCGSCLGRSF